MTMIHDEETVGRPEKWPTETGVGGRFATSLIREDNFYKLQRDLKQQRRKKDIAKGMILLPEDWEGMVSLTSSSDKKKERQVKQREN